MNTFRILPEYYKSNPNILKHRWKMNGKFEKNQWENPWKIYEYSMRNLWKSSLEACWSFLVPLGVPYWHPWASWDHFGSVLRASSSVLGASRWHPGARRRPHLDPRKRPKSSKNRSKIALIFWSIFRYDFDPKMVTEWLPKPSENDPKKCFIFRSFFFIDF